MFSDRDLEANLEPKEDTREAVYTCDECGEPIRDGDSYCLLNGYYFCEDCVNDSWRVV